MNWPAPESAVTKTIAISTGLAEHAAPGRERERDRAHAARHVARPRPRRSRRARRPRRRRCASRRCRRARPRSGCRSTEAIDQPMKMKVMSRPRCSGALIAPIAAAACGVNAAAPSTVSARIGSSVA